MHKVYYNTIAKKEFKLHIYSKNNDIILEPELSVSHYKTLFMEFVSEGLETKNVSFSSHGNTVSGSYSPSQFNFYFDDDYRMRHTNIYDSEWRTYTYTVPVI
jgi:hypothetical protein